MNAQEIRRLFFRAIEIEPARRLDFLEGSGASTEVRDAVLTLLRHDSGGETFLDQAIANEVPPSTLAGQRFGAYQLSELLGQGGMGVVFKAERVDGELRQMVAIKIVERAWLHPAAMERFRRERQILAGLIHPNIAQLLDGGTREDGLPYLVMEYVDGLRLDHYCEQRQLGIAERLRIFLPLCDAVEHAHRKLIIHRDLKPSNVMVTAEGTPKLLDFGVAKAIGDGVEGATRTLVLTPAFASPEQVLNLEITTATDVYGLGALLYQLLAGRAPHAVEGVSPFELQRAICEIGPDRPSQHRPALKGDLENILLKALHPEPARRYHSARELADDVSRYLDRRPVIATSFGWQYRTRRFVQRHAMATAGAALAVLAILGAAGVSVYEARRAQQRFDQVRELSNRFIFDFENSIRDVPGTLEARQMVAATARKYLESLAQDNSGDVRLKRELAESRYLLSRVEVNAAQSAAAVRDNEQAVALLRSLKADCCGSAADRFLFIRALTDLARYRQGTYDVNSTLPLSTEAVTNARAWLAQAPQDPQAQRALSMALSTHGVNLQSAGRFTDARRVMIEAADSSKRIAQLHPDDDVLAYEHARVVHFLGGICISMRDGEGARDYGAIAAQILERLVDRHPGNARWRNMYAMADSTRSAGFSLLAEKTPALWAQAVDNARQAFALADENRRLNPRQSDEADTASVLASRLADALNHARHPAEAEQFIRKSGEILDDLLRRDPSNHRFQRMRFINRTLLGDMQLDHAVWAEAAQTLAEALTYINDYLRSDGADAVALDMKVSALADQAIVKRHFGQTAAARDLCSEGLQVAAGLIHRDPAMEKSISDLGKLRQVARDLAVPDPSASVGRHP